jgi:hypothetical protein
VRFRERRHELSSRHVLPDRQQSIHGVTGRRRSAHCSAEGSLKKDITTDCIEWDGFCNEKGYGITSFNGKLDRIHRIAWAEVHGPIPEGVCILHKCDNPPCFNVDHLFAGSKADNNADMRKKKRHSHGETHGMSKLTGEQVDEIRALSLAGAITRRLAEKYKVTDDAISSITSGEGWVHRPFPPAAVEVDPALCVAFCNPSRGEQAHSAKMTEAKVVAIRSDYAKGKFTMRQLGEKYGLSSGTVSRIVHRQKWAHVP